jgi:hypothetical protein
MTFANEELLPTPGGDKMEETYAYQLARSHLTVNQPHLCTAPQSRLHSLLQIYLPVSEMEDEHLLSEFSAATVASLTCDVEAAPPHCGIFVDDEEVFEPDQSGDDLAHLALVTTTNRFEASCEMDDPFEVDMFDEPVGMEPDEQEQVVRSKSSNPMVQLSIYGSLQEPCDANLLLTDLMGATSSLYTFPVCTLTSLGLVEKSDLFDLRLSHDCVYLAPVSAGYNRGARRYGWFGRRFKSLRSSKPEKNPTSMNLGALLDELREHVLKSVGEHALSRHAIRPLAKAHVELGNRVLVADAWPVTRFVSVAVALPRSSSGKSVVRSFRNWSQGNLGKSEITEVTLSVDLLRLIESAPTRKGKRHVRHVDFLFAGAPEPRVNYTSQAVDKIRKLIVRREMSEQPTLIVLESAT